jgi:hypothetical protein
MNKEIAKIAAKWWADKLRSPAMLDNGDNSEAGFMTNVLATIVQQSEREDVTESKISKFEEELTKLITKMDKGYVYIGVDYDPCVVLSDAAQKADLKLGMTTLPWKTNMNIDPNGTIEVSEGYGGEWHEVK